MISWNITNENCVVNINVTIIRTEIQKNVLANGSLFGSCCTSRFSSQYELMVFNFGVVPARTTEISYKDSRIE
jgi:hypothetical protein